MSFTHLTLASRSRSALPHEVLLSVGALAGGAMLFLVPDGSALGMPLSMLEHTGFRSCRFPGLILFVVNGVFPLVSAMAMLRGRPWAPQTVMVIGALLVGWIVVQVALLRSFFWPLHGAYLLLGVVLAALGVAQHRATRWARCQAGITR
jgi:hypothetical protein